MERLVCLGRIAVRRIYGRVLRVTLQRGRRFFLLVNLFLTMSCPTPSDFQNLVVDPNSAACDQLRKLGLLAEMVADAYECIYNEDGSLSQTFIDKLCATGCGEGTTSTTTTSGGGTGEQEYTSAGSYEFTVPGGVTLMTITAVGGGGGGGGQAYLGTPVPCGASPYSGVASGGGSGEKRSGSFAVTPGEVLTIVVGGGGGQVFGTRQGLPGYPSYVVNGSSTTLVNANGGSGGAWGCCASGPFAGGAGGTGGTGGTGTTGNAGGATTAPSGCANGSGGAGLSVRTGLTAGAGSSGDPNNVNQHPGSAGAVRLTW